MSKILQLYPVGDEICVVMKYRIAQYKGYKTRIYVRDANTWKIQMEYAISSIAPREAPLWSQQIPALVTAQHG